MSISKHYVDTSHLHLLSLCSGAGMLDAGVSAALASHGIRARTVAYCEREAAACACLRSRMEEAALEPAPVWGGNLEQFPAAGFHGLVDGIVAGFPCQPHSVAGKRQGRHDERNLLPAILSIADAAGAWLLFLENVAGLKKEFDYIAEILLQSGWNMEWGTLRASDAGASHRRDRWFCLAHRQHLPVGAQRQLASWRRANTRKAHRSMPGAAGGAVLADSGGLRGERSGDAGKLGGPRAAHEGGHGREQWNAADSGGGQLLAHGAGAERRPAETGRGEKGGTAASGRRGQLGHAHHPRPQGRRLHTGEHPGELSAGPAGAELEHAAGQRRGEGRAEPAIRRGRDSPAGPGGELGHGHGAGCEWPGPAESAGWECDPVPAGAGLPVFAPGPEDPGWTGILSRCPWLAPALPDVALRRVGDSLFGGDEVETEPAVHGLADGMASIVGTARADMLRIAGNGVVPRQAARAFGQLINRMLTPP